MKKILITLAFLFTCLITWGQVQVDISQYKQTVTKEDTLFRLQTVQIKSSEFAVDTFVVDIQPQKWLNEEEYSAFIEQTINASFERQESLRQLFIQQRNETSVAISIYDQINGDGAYLVKQKDQLLSQIQGEWIFRRRISEGNSQTKAASISGTTVTVEGLPEGTITITDDLTVTVSGLYAFNLDFVVRNGGLRADRGQQIFVLRK